MAQTNVQAFSGDVAISSNLAVDTNTLFVDSVGNKVGIGTTNPDSRLTVLAPNAVMPSLYNAEYRNGASIMVSENEYDVETARSALNHNSTIILSSDHAHDSGYNAGGSIGFAAKNEFGGYTVQYGQISGVREDNFYGGLSFSTMHNLSDGKLREDMRIINGNVGIGTNAPGATLHVYNNSLGSTTGNSTDILHFGGDSGGAGALLLTAERLSTGSDWSSTGLRLQKIVDVTKMAYVQFGSNTGNVSGELLFGNGDATERMRIASNGNVGIGTTNPPGMLSIYTGDTAKCGFSIDRYATGEYRTEFYQGANGLDIKVGHGTVAPTTVVDIERFSAISSRLRINSPGCLRTDGGVEVASYNDITSVKMIWDTGSRYRIYADTDNRMIFSTAGGNGTLAATTCLGLNGTNLGVGLPTPSHKLHVAGNVLASGFFNHRQQFTVATGVTTTVVTMPNGCQGHVYLIGNNYIFAAARFAYKAGWMGIYFVSIYSSNLTTWTNNGQNIWARHDRGSNQTVVCRTLHVGDY